MKKKVIIGIVIAAGLVIIAGITAFCIHNKKTTQNSKPKILATSTTNSIKNTKITTTNKDKTSIATESPDIIPSYISKIETTNYDTDYWWDTSFENLINQLKIWNTNNPQKDLKTIIDNSSKIPSYLIRLCVMHPEAIPYVAGYIDNGYNPKRDNINISNYPKTNGIPLFEQFDKQWGYNWYGNGPIAMDGCGPTSLSMIIVGLTDNEKANPLNVATTSDKLGGYTWNHGSNQTLFTTVAEHYGLVPHQVSGNQIFEALKNGEPVMVSCHAGAFTLSGHIIVLSGITPDGKVMINNPDSIKDSHTLWSQETILNNINYAYAYSKQK